VALCIVGPNAALNVIGMISAALHTSVLFALYKHRKYEDRRLADGIGSYRNRRRLFFWSCEQLRSVSVSFLSDHGSGDEHFFSLFQVP